MRRLEKDNIYSSALSLTKGQALWSEVAEKYNTGQVDIQAKLLWLQAKDATEGPGQAGAQALSESSYDLA
jgi:hypothetical protein